MPGPGLSVSAYVYKLPYCTVIFKLNCYKYDTANTDTPLCTLYNAFV